MMSTCRSIFVTLTIALALQTIAPLARAQVPLLQRGKEMKNLEMLLGEWKGEISRHRPNGATWELQSDITFTWDVGDAWLKGHDFTTQPTGRVIEDLVWMTWNAREGHYCGAWQDNVFPQIVTFTGTWNDDGDKLTLDTGSFDISGRPHRVVQTYTFVSKDEYRTEMRQAWDGNEPRLVAEGRFVRLSEEGV